MRRALALAALLTLGACGGDSKQLDAAGAPGTSTTASTTTSTSVAAVDAAPSSTTTPPASARPVATTTPTTAKAKTATTAPPATTATTARPAAPTSTTRAAPAAAITIQNFAFSPATLDVTAGTRVTATNRDGAGHTWTSDNGAWDSGTLAKDASFAFTFTAPGTYTYRCNIHTSMRGTVTVR